MCGIVGALSFKGSPFSVTEDYIAKMRDAMAHRGPDGADVYVSRDARVGLGHRRLSIIDLSDTASQPMANEDGSILLVFNGEIYNHAAIRAELTALGGHVWRTDHSDTETIIHAYEQWGTGCLEKLRGMFALALWDEKRRRMWLVRDRIGVKPLYYSIHHGRIVFASEIKALLQDPEQPREVCEEALFHYLTFLASPAPLTLFEGIRKLPGGTWLTAGEDGRVEVRRYWDALDGQEDLGGLSEEAISARLMEELAEAVRLRGISDVPVGIFLSGGIDSSANTALFARTQRGAVKTFSIGYQGDCVSYRNELGYARMMAESVGAQHYELLLGVDDLIDFLPRMIHLQDEPIGDPVCVPLYYVSKLARDNGVIVCQVGEGADELFCGYPSWKLALSLARNFSPLPGLVKKGLAAATSALGKQYSQYSVWMRRDSQGLPMFFGGAEAFGEPQKRRFLSERLRAKFAKTSSYEAIAPIRARFEDKARETSLVNWMAYLDLNIRLPELLLMRVDKMSMGVSLECRVPFLDHRFVEYCLSIPAAVRIKDGELKHILKKTVRGLIPDAIIDRPKQGFGIPVQEWFLDKLGETTRRAMDEVCGRTDFFDRAEVSRFLESGPRARAWPLLNFALWWKTYIAGDSVAPGL